MGFRKRYVCPRLDGLGSPIKPGGADDVRVFQEVGKTFFCPIVGHPTCACAASGENEVFNQLAGVGSIVTGCDS